MVAAIHSDVEIPREYSKDPADSNGFLLYWSDCEKKKIKEMK